MDLARKDQKELDESSGGHWALAEYLIEKFSKSLFPHYRRAGSQFSFLHMSPLAWGFMEYKSTKTSTCFLSGVTKNRSLCIQAGSKLAAGMCMVYEAWLNAAVSCYNSILSLLHPQLHG